MVDYYKDQKRDNNDMYLILTFSRNPLLIMKRLLFILHLNFIQSLSIYLSIDLLAENACTCLDWIRFWVIFMRCKVVSGSRCSFS